MAIIAGPISKRGDGSVGRCGDCATLCVFCVRRGLRRSGGVVRGLLRRPCRPLQVIGVLATVLPIARKSRQFSCSAERAGKVPIPAQINLAKSGERLHANTVRPMGRSSATQSSIELPRDSYRTNSSCWNEVNDWRKSTDSLCDRSLKAWEAIMSSPIHLDDNTEPTLAYASPWARERILPVAISGTHSCGG